MKIPALILATVLLVSCAHYIVHPGAVNTADSMAYDAIRDSKAVIDTARIQFSNKQLPDSLKPALNKLVDAYNVAYPAYNVWRDAIQAGKPSDALYQALNTDLLNLSAALASFRKGN